MTKDDFEKDLTEATTEALAAYWLEAKAAESAAQQYRRTVEEAIAKRVAVPEEGSKTHAIGPYKVVTTGVLSRSLDADKWAEIASQIPEGHHPLTWKPEVAKKGLKWLQENHPDEYNLFCTAMTVKPGKTQVKVERIEDETP